MQAAGKDAFLVVWLVRHEHGLIDQYWSYAEPSG